MTVPLKTPLVNSINLSRQTDSVLFCTHLQSGEAKSFTSKFPFAFYGLHDEQYEAKLAGTKYHHFKDLATLSLAELPSW